MGFAVENNWFIVVKDQLPRPSIDETRTYIKDGYRDFPVSDDAVTYELPVILRGECIGMGIVTMQIQVAKQTHIKYKLVTRFDDNDPVAKHYTNQYRKAKGEKVDD